jgi:hypothetical protein
MITWKHVISTSTKSLADWRICIFSRLAHMYEDAVGIYGRMPLQKKIACRCISRIVIFISQKKKRIVIFN